MGVIWSTALSAMAESDENPSTSSRSPKVDDSEEDKELSTGSEEVVRFTDEELTGDLFICNVCQKRFRHAPVLYTHRAMHEEANNSKRKLVKDRRRLFPCPVKSCINHAQENALKSIKAIRKHYGRKHGKATWMCDGCNKSYAIKNDWQVRNARR